MHEYMTLTGSSCGLPGWGFRGFRVLAVCAGMGLLAVVHVGGLMAVVLIRGLLVGVCP
jgi:hypothetical protein